MGSLRSRASSRPHGVKGSRKQAKVAFVPQKEASPPTHVLKCLCQRSGWFVQVRGGCVSLAQPLAKYRRHPSPSAAASYLVLQGHRLGRVHERVVLERPLVLQRLPRRRHGQRERRRQRRVRRDHVQLVVRRRPCRRRVSPPPVQSGGCCTRCGNRRTWYAVTV